MLVWLAVILLVAWLLGWGVFHVAGGLIPLSPYILLSSAVHGLAYSAVVTLAALGVFGYLKGRYTGTGPGRSALQTMVIGGVAAAAAFALAKLIS